jgi:hypothetical protein
MTCDPVKHTLVLAVGLFANLAPSTVAEAEAQVVVERAVKPDSSRMSGRTAQPRRSPFATGWEIEGYGGLSLGRIPTGGESDLPGPGSPLTTSSPLFPSRRVSSWFFGDGAVLLNAVNAEFGLSQAITPLDGALTTLGLDSATGGVFGFRARRAVTRRYSAEFSVDVMNGTTTLTDDLLAGVESSRESFGSAMAALFSTGPFSDPVVDAMVTSLDGSSREVAVTGAATYLFLPDGATVPYVTLGGGMLFSSGDPVSITLEGRYQTTIAGVVPIEEFDRVTLRFDRDQAWIGVIGGGVSQAMSETWGFRVDGRVLLGENRARLLLDASPEVPAGTPAGFIESFTNPGIQFSNNSSTGRLSSLSGPAIRDFPVFTGGGLETRFLMTVGVYLRF